MSNETINQKVYAEITLRYTSSNDGIKSEVSRVFNFNANAPTEQVAVILAGHHAIKLAEAFGGHDNAYDINVRFANVQYGDKYLPMHAFQAKSKDGGWDFVQA